MSADQTLSVIDQQKFVADIVLYVITQEQKRCLLRKADIFKAVFQFPSNSKFKLSTAFKEQLLEEAADKLSHIFGLELRPSQSEKYKGTFILLNKLQVDPTDPHLSFSREDTIHMGLLYTVLSLIFMSNGVVSEDVLFNFLYQMGVYESSDSNHRQSSQKYSEESETFKVFGDVKHLVNNVWATKQHYLAITKDSVMIDQCEVVTNEYRWGERSHCEVRKSDMLKVMADLYKCEPKCFKKQYDEVIAEEGVDAFSYEEEQPQTEMETESENENEN